MKCRACKTEIRTEKTVAEDHVVGICSNPQCSLFNKRMMYKVQKDEAPK